MELELNSTCCLCGEQIDGYGNNPSPLSINEKDRCCDSCNFDKVIPARIHQLFINQEENQKNGTSN